MRTTASNTMDKPILSVLMSVYNETESYIRDSVSSLLKQTFQDFEIIVVNDNPQRVDVAGILDSFHDSRILFYQNQKNIGLALSMNKAAELASAEVFARMDADDIAEPNRLSEEYELLSTGVCDFVFSNYYKIDSEGNVISEKAISYPTESIDRVVNLNPGLIHHPTVIFTKSIFEKAGKYRDFPCSQDGDLWMRMAECGCRFAMIDKCLLRYRVYPNSVTNRKWLLQKLTCNYIYELSIQRLKTGRDSYSKEDYEKYLTSYGVNSLNAEQKAKRADYWLELAQKNGANAIQRFLLRLGAFLYSPLIRRGYLNICRKKLMLK